MYTYQGIYYIAYNIYGTSSSSMSFAITLTIIIIIIILITTTWLKQPTTINADIMFVV